MKLSDIGNALETVTENVAYFEFDEGKPPLPYIAYFEDDTDGVFADDEVYAGRTNIQVELYTKRRDLQLEHQLEAALNTLGVTWQRDGAVKVEKAIMTVYSFQIIREDEENE